MVAPTPHLARHAWSADDGVVESPMAETVKASLWKTVLLAAFCLRPSTCSEWPRMMMVCSGVLTATALMKVGHSPSRIIF